MKIRRRILPAGWYPSGEAETAARVKKSLANIGPTETQGRACVVPHAGWDFSGEIALRGLRGICQDTKTIVIVGGHLHPRDGVLAAFEEGYETPLGPLPADLELLSFLADQLKLGEDVYSDNTVEVNLPFVKYLFPEGKVLGLRASPSRSAEKLGALLHRAARSLQKKIAVVGSTDLTHYGPNYGFTPQGSGTQAVQWVKDVNDRRLIDALLNLDPSKAIDLANQEHSACSVGGAVAAACFARAGGCRTGTLLAYTSSYDIHPSSSFVGYAAIIYGL